MLHVLTFGNESQSRRAIEPTVDFQLAMPAEGALEVRLVGFAVEADEGIFTA